MNTTRITGIILISLLLISSGTALSVGGDTIDLTDPDQSAIDDAVATYNEQYADQVPGLAVSLIRNERINANVTLQTGESIVYGVDMDDLNISTVEEGGVTDPTLTVYTHENTLETIANAENPKNRAVKAFKQGDIWYETTGFLRTVKYGVVSTLIKVFG